METSHLREYVALARIGGFTAAAKELHITQSTLSKHIAALEREFDCDLLVRSREGCVLTEPGKLLYMRALGILATLDQTKSEMAGLAPQGSDIAIDLSAPVDPSLTQACQAAAATHGLSRSQVDALALYLGGAPLDSVAVRLACSRDEASVLIAGAYQTLGASSKEQALAIVRKCG